LTLIGTFRFQLPTVFNQILKFIGISVGSTTGSTYAIGCLFSYNYLTLTAALFIVAGILVPGLFYWLFTMARAKHSKIPNEELELLDATPSPTKKSSGCPNFMKIYGTTCLVLVFMIHPNVALQVFTILSPCVEIDDQLLMLNDLSVNCHDSNFYTFKLLSWSFGLPFVVVTILIWIIILFFYRNHLNEPEVKEKFYFIYASYSPDFYYWEIVVTFRKVGIAFISAVLATTPQLQLITGIAFLNAVLIIHLQTYPMVDMIENRLETGSLTCALFTLIVSLYQTQLDMEQALLILILVVNGVFVLIALFFITIEGIKAAKELAITVYEGLVSCYSKCWMYCHRDPENEYSINDDEIDNS